MNVTPKRTFTNCQAFARNSTNAVKTGRNVALNIHSATSSAFLCGMLGGSISVVIKKKKKETKTPKPQFFLLYFLSPHSIIEIGLCGLFPEANSLLFPFQPLHSIECCHNDINLCDKISSIIFIQEEMYLLQLGRQVYVRIASNKPANPGIKIGSFVQLFTYRTLFYGKRLCARI